MSQRCGSVSVEARHTAAQDPHSGGNLINVLETAFGIRAIIGDVKAHGPLAAGLADEIGVAFGELARHEPRLQGLAQRLDSFVAERVGAFGECFVPASLIQVGVGIDTADLIVCGHPVPLMMRGNDTCPVSVLGVELPLGLRHLNGDWHSPTTFDFAVGDALLLHTGGAIEARDSQGEVFPLEQRAGQLSGEDPKVLLDRLKAELLAHGGDRAKDEITLLFMRAEEPGFLGYVPERRSAERVRPRSRFS